MKDSVLFEGSSEYGVYRIVETIYEGRPARVLFSDGEVPQSGMALDDEPDLLFDYNQRLLEVALSLRPESVLVIGGGMLSLPTALSYHFPQAMIDVVEIDPLLPQLARQFFDAADDSAINVYVQDGVDYMAACTKQYDLIVIDAFSGFAIAHPLLTIEPASRYATCLTTRGVVAVNFISKYYTRKPSLAHELCATFSSVFGEVELYSADPEYSKHAEQNIILVASRTVVDLDYVQSTVVHLLPVREY